MFIKSYESLKKKTKNRTLDYLYWRGKYRSGGEGGEWHPVQYYKIYKRVRCACAETPRRGAKPERDVFLLKPAATNSILEKSGPRHGGGRGQIS